jgi:hypothetical protein
MNIHKLKNYTHELNIQILEEIKVCSKTVTVLCVYIAAHTPFFYYYNTQSEYEGN